MPRLILLLGIGIIILNFALVATFPAEAAWMPDGFTVPILAYEFLQTSEEVQRFFGEPGPEQDQWIAGMRLGHQLDYIYLLFYASFLAAWGWYCGQFATKKIAYVVITLAVIAAAADVLENIQLVEITYKLAGQNMDPELRLLFLFTWLKWGSLALALAALSPYFLERSWLGKTLVGISFITLILGSIAFFDRSVVTSYFTTGIALQFLLLFIFAILNLRKEPLKLR